MGITRHQIWKHFDQFFFSVIYSLAMAQNFRPWLGQLQATRGKLGQYLGHGSFKANFLARPCQRADFVDLWPHWPNNQTFIGPGSVSVRLHVSNQANIQAMACQGQLSLRTPATVQIAWFWDHVGRRWPQESTFGLRPRPPSHGLEHHLSGHAPRFSVLFHTTKQLLKATRGSFCLVFGCQHWPRKA